MPLGIDVILPVELTINTGCTSLLFQPVFLFNLHFFVFTFLLNVIKIAYFCDKI